MSPNNLAMSVCQCSHGHSEMFEINDPWCGYVNLSMKLEVCHLQEGNVNVSM